MISLPKLKECKQFEILDCSSNNLTSLPKLKECKQLEILHCYNNNLTLLPELKECKELYILWCYSNNLTLLPKLKKCKKLQYLYCSNNFIKYSEIPNRFNSYYNRQYHVNYLVTKIMRVWKKYHYFPVLGNSYNGNIKYDIICFI